MKQIVSRESSQAGNDVERRREPRSPRGEGGGARTFCVQRHDATQLHFDLRLEMAGVLKSWAVPKGIPLDPRERRLAIQGEDHPLSYGTFEGTIPEGQYGAGIVRLWDRGTWIPEGDPLEAYEKGRLFFTLKGTKLTGRWSLIRFRSSLDRPGKGYWLLRKVRARAAAKRSSGGTSRSRGGSSGRRRAGSRVKVPGAVPGPLPSGIKPQMAVLGTEVPLGDEWFHEVKSAGYRLLTILDRQDLRMVPRDGRDWSARLPTLAAELKTLPARSAILDGEIVSLTRQGTSSFGALKGALAKGEERNLFYYAFDLLYLNGLDLRRTPLIERKTALARLLGAARRTPHLRYVDHVRGRGDLFYRHSCELGLEGMVSKRKDSFHTPGRSIDWVTLKCQQRQDFVIGGYTDPRPGWPGVGALLLGHYHHGGLVYAGRVSTGISKEQSAALPQRLAPLHRQSSPFREGPSRLESRDVRWVEPRLVAEVSFTDWTRDRRLRQPAFLGLREDRAAKEIVLERPAKVPPPAVLTHPERVLYPESGITKRDLARYYEDMAPWILPHVRGRLLTIVRCPAGAPKPCFYQKHHQDSMPEALRGLPILEQHKSATGLYIDNVAGLLSLVQLGVLELHPWASRVEDLEHPDRCIFDLDPGPGVPWKEIVRAAHELGGHLQGLGLESFVKTTGGKGLHLVVPLEGSPEWTTLKAFSRRVAADFIRGREDRFTLSMSKSRRTGRIFIDTLRNERGATAVAAYSSRATPRATVSAPLAWKELTASLRPDQFTIGDMIRRVARLSIDPWARMFEVRQSIPPGTV
jgi:bifunctional non-homologous end joining protein LigD